MVASSVSLRQLLTAAVAGLPLASGASCPYIHGNGNVNRDAAPPHPMAAGSLLQARADDSSSDFGKCPRKSKVASGGTRSKDWWPCALNIGVLRQNQDEVNPLGGDFDYASEFAKIDVEELKKDLTELTTNSQVWWPADFGNYGPFFIRLSWHNAGTYRQEDGRGGAGMGQQRFAPLNAWPDNASLDKARRLLWPIKQKYGSKLSWADLMTYAGTLALENMGVPLYGFGFGRVDTWQSDEGIYWGSETELYPAKGSWENRYNGSTDIYGRAENLESPLGAANMGLIYVDPEGPGGNPVPAASALDTRMTFGRMGMNDEETVALIAGGHAFGKTHGAVEGKYIGGDPMSAPIESQGLGWKNNFSTGVADYAYTSGIEVIWSETPTKWANEFLHSLLFNNWTLTKGPSGATHWIAEEANATYPDPFVPNKFRKPTMLTSDLGLIHDPIYKNISTTFYNDFDYFTEKFSLAWYKLVHRDMGPLSRYLGPWVPKSEPLIWQDPLPTVTYQTIDNHDAERIKADILAAPGLNISNLITTAWGSASSFRISDKRGGANGARIALEPQVSWKANNPDRLKPVLKSLQSVVDKFNAVNDKKQVSLADVIVLGGSAAIEKAAKDAGTPVKVPFCAGRVDATQDQTDVTTFGYLEAKADGFRNYGVGTARALTEELLVDKASLLSLTPPQLTVLVGGLRALDANYDGSKFGILTDRPGQLTNDFFVNLLNVSTVWSPLTNGSTEYFKGTDLYSGADKYTATRSDLIFGYHPELRAVAEVYGSTDAQGKFVKDFVAAWTKVMDLDRYDIKGRKQNNVQ